MTTIFTIPSMKNRTEPNRTETEPYLYRTRTDHEPIFLKSTQNPNRTETLSSKNLNRTRTPKLWVLSHV